MERPWLLNNVVSDKSDEIILKATDKNILYNLFSFTKPLRCLDWNLMFQSSVPYLSFDRQFSSGVNYRFP